MGCSRAFTLALAACAAAAAGSSPAEGQCRLCDKPTTTENPASAGAKDVALEVETSIDFGRLVVAAPREGSATLRPDGSTTASGSVAGLGVRAMVGSAVISGQPGKPVRVQLPARIVLTSIRGAEIVFEDVSSDLPSLPRLDSAGRLAFRFGGRLRVNGDAEGQYHGELPILVEYP